MFNTTQPSTGGFSFGASSASKPATSTGFSFATPTSTATSTNPTGSLFGGNATLNTTAPSTTPFGGFSSQPAAGSTTTTSKFGFPSASNQATGLSTNTGFGLGGTTTSLFSGAGNINQQNRDKQVYQLLLQADEEARRQQALVLTSEEQYKPQNVWQALALLRSWWDPSSPYCKFKCYFYNLVPPQEVHLYQKPQNHDKKAWDEAQKKNPDPSRLVPALAVGFDDVKKRMEAQERQAGAHLATLKEIQDKIKKLKGADAQSTANKLDEYKRRQMDLTQRVIKILKYAQVLRNKGLPLTSEEEAMRTLLENVQDQLLRSEQFRGKLSQLWAQLQLIKESGRKYDTSEDARMWSGMSEQDMGTITKILGEQTHGIEHTIDILEHDQMDVDNMLARYREKH
ncbi:hypothetical protein O0I10_004443 [Lichtheimia ornata]|uniref:Nucleoporin Nup54 alpha-helical domain-containing protein n=1 Tax=Lichtheimia ornata TaxID=688661 RepID=A0AAD7V7Q9_9FUNG|nr:uncharacterized protein O0I10_004443 [Lichtheimia ornata]KAJ8659850.1 hypothetical protein O0I10_004443 [Lichtheimia ornata]